MEHNTILVVDARTRYIEIFMASVTKLEDMEALVFRKAGPDLGSVFGFQEMTIDLPIFVFGNYQARSSDGFTEYFYDKNSPVIKKATWVGGVGFGYPNPNYKDPEILTAIQGALLDSSDEFVSKIDPHQPKMLGEGLRPFGKILSGIVIPAGATIRPVETHKNSNCATCDAAIAALNMSTKIFGHIYVMEGQSDCVEAIEIVLPEEAKAAEFPVEHRQDYFSAKNMLQASIRRESKVALQERNLDAEIALRYMLLKMFQNINVPLQEVNDILKTVSPELLDLLDTESIHEVVNAKYEALVSSGWKIIYGCSNVHVLSPAGYRSRNLDLRDFCLLKKEFLDNANMSIEEINERKDDEFLVSIDSFCKSLREDESLYVSIEHIDDINQKLWFPSGLLDEISKGPEGEEPEQDDVYSYIKKNIRMSCVKKVEFKKYSLEGEYLKTHLWTADFPFAVQK